MRIPALLAALLVAGPAAAKPPVPVIELRARSIDGFLKLADYFAGLSDQPDMGKSVVALANAFTQPKTGLQGLDRTRPMGAYAITTAAGQPAFAVMIPVRDKDKFLALLTDRLNVAVADSETGSMLTVPNVPVPLFVAFHADYAYVTAFSADWLAAENLVEPKAFFATKLADNSLLGLVVHVDDVSPEFKTAAVAQAELRTADDVKKGAKPGEGKGEVAIRLFALRKTVSALAAVIKQGKTITADLSIDPATDQFDLVAKVVPLPGTPMAAYVKSLGERKGHSLATNTSDAVAGRLNFALPESARAEWAGVADKLLDDMLAESKTDDDRAASKLFAKGIRPTFESGIFDGAVAVSGGETRVVSGVVGLVDGREAEASARAMLAFIPEKEGRAKFDVAEAGVARLHEVKLAKPAEPFGDKVWLGTTPDRLAVSTGGLDAAKSLSTRETAAGPIAELRMGVVQIGELTKTKDAAERERVKLAAKKVFGDAPLAGRDEYTLRLNGGDALTFKMSAKGKAFAYFAAIGDAKKGE